MTGLLQIRGVSEDERRALKARAAARGQSLNAFMLEVIRRETASPPVAEVLARAARRAERAPTSAVDVIQAARGERRDSPARSTGGRSSAPKAARRSARRR